MHTCEIESYKYNKIGIVCRGMKDEYVVRHIIVRTVNSQFEKLKLCVSINQTTAAKL